MRLNISPLVKERLAECACKGLDKRALFLKHSVFVGFFAVFLERQGGFCGFRFKRYRRIVL
jgi:hypothetical protein